MLEMLEYSMHEHNHFDAQLQVHLQGSVQKNKQARAHTHT